MENDMKRSLVQRLILVAVSVAALFGQSAWAAQGDITTVAGGAGSTADGGPATNTSLSNPRGVAVDSSGSLFVADAGNSRIRKVSG